MELHEIREEIRQIDEEMAELFVRRMEAVRKVAAYKNQRGLPVLDREQEARVIQGRSALIKDPELQPFYREFLQETMDISKRWQVYLIQRKRDGMQC
jgi:chorismate mutase/prephenate dehydratase